ncbi:MAG: hypothetical protein ACYSUY_18795 [Planctomycetota bacterium]|jgi:peptidoglycan hydrolase CwlO-like protein
MLKKVFLLGITALLLLSMQLNILGTISAEEYNKNAKDEIAILRQYMSGPTGDGKSSEEMRKEREQWKQKMFQENLPRALAFVKELDREFYDLVTKDDKLREEFEQDFMKHVELWLKFQQTASPRAELELKQLIFSGHLQLLERQYREEENKDKRIQIRDGMKKLLTRFFDVKIRIREFEIRELQAELNKLKEQVQHARNNKTEQIDIFLMKMTASETETIFDN